jgi:hypothetical protein
VFENIDINAGHIEENVVQRIQLVCVLLIALMLGALIALIDASPGWDDTGVSVAMLLVASGLLGTLHPVRAWLWALALACGYPLLGIALHGSATTVVGIVLPLAFALVGASTRAFVGRRIGRSNN